MSYKIAFVKTHMRNENKETFTITRAQLKALQIIERETKMPVAVQLMHAHRLWIASKNAKRTRK
jgi:hypothetical protein